LKSSGNEKRAAKIEKAGRQENFLKKSLAFSASGGRFWSKNLLQKPFSLFLVVF